jgi:predicted RNA binding protein YcfA (HicA-like mRNA interferase family)
MTKLKRVEGAQIVKLLLRHGFSIQRQKGSHVFLSHPNGIKEVIPIHSGKELPVGLILKILKNTGIEKEDYNKKI